MRILSMTQPWASLKMPPAINVWTVGLRRQPNPAPKRNETRSWATPYRGWVLIHAAKAWTQADRDLLEEEPFNRALEECFPHYDGAKSLPRGCLLGVANLTAVVATENFNPTRYGPMSVWEAAFGDYGPRRYIWCFTDERPFSTPVPFRGAQGLVTVHERLSSPIEQVLHAGATVIDAGLLERLRGSFPGLPLAPKFSPTSNSP